jgi:hypothetical protein
VILPDESNRKASIINCPRCYLVNVMENKYCSTCSYPLVPSAFEEIKMMEEIQINELKSKYDSDIAYLKNAIKELQELMKHPLELDRAITSH